MLDFRNVIDNIFYSQSRQLTMEAPNIKLKLYTPEILEAFTHGRVGITLRTSGVFSLSTALAEIMQVKVGDKILIAQNENAPLELFVLRHDTGFALRRPKGNSAAFGFTSKKLRNILLKACGLEDKTYSFLVSKEPIQVGNDKCWCIITRSAKPKVSEPHR